MGPMGMGDSVGMGVSMGVVVHTDSSGMNEQLDVIG